MCITFFYIPKPNTNEKFILSFNRDESMKKQSAKLGYFDEDQNIIAGRDLEGKGTWCGINKQTGVVAFLTNYDTENFHDITDIQYGRGNLTYRFLKTDFIDENKNNEIDQKIKDGLNNILNELNMYNAFNLVIGNITTNNFYYICNPYNQLIKKTEKPILLEQGQTYALTNTDIYTMWSKSKHGLDIFNSMISKYNKMILNEENEQNNEELIKQMKQLMFDQTKFNPDPESESSIFVKQYYSKYSKKQRGTVSSCYIILDQQIKGIYEELYLVDKNHNQLFQQPIITTLKI